MFELYDIWTNTLIFTGTAKEISEYTGHNVRAVYRHGISGTRLGYGYLVKWLHDKHKMFNVYKHGVLVAKCMSAKDISKKFYITYDSVYILAKNGKKTRDGLEIKERVDYYE